MRSSLVRFSHARYIMPTTAGVRGRARARARVGGRVKVWVGVRVKG